MDGKNRILSLIHISPLHWIEKVYVSETVEKQDTEVMEKASRTEWEAVTDSVFRQMSDTQTPQGVMTVPVSYTHLLLHWHSEL